MFCAINIFGINWQTNYLTVTILYLDLKGNRDTQAFKNINRAKSTAVPIVIPDKPWMHHWKPF